MQARAFRDFLELEISAKKCYNQRMKILGIESTCDETAAAVVDFDVSNLNKKSSRKVELLSNEVVSQIDIHAEFGGVVPEVAARSHIEVINPVVARALSRANLTWADIDAVAVSFAPGLNGSLLIGNLAAHTYASVLGKPIFPVHHVEAHIYGAFLSEETRPEFPFLSLVVSGGHSQIVLVKGHGDFEILGQTQDDAVGEAFDKVAKILGLPYPGGPSISRAAELGDAGKYKLPKAKLAGEFDFSFSGLKTAVLRAVQKEVSVDVNFPSFELANLLSEEQKNDFAASFQATAVSTLIDKLEKAAEKFEATCVVVAGGVAANQLLRKELARRMGDKLPAGVKFVRPEFCTDNAAMVAALGAYHAALGGPKTAGEVVVKPSLSMENSPWCA